MAELGCGSCRLVAGIGRNCNRKSHPAFSDSGSSFYYPGALAAQFVHFAISRNREFLANASAVELTRNPQGLKHALIKISQSPLEVRDAKQADRRHVYCLSLPQEKKKKSALLATHPPIEERIKRLENMYVLFLPENKIIPVLFRQNIIIDFPDIFVYNCPDMY